MDSCLGDSSLSWSQSNVYVVGRVGREAGNARRGSCWRLVDIRVTEGGRASGCRTKGCAAVRAAGFIETSVVDDPVPQRMSQTGVLNLLLSLSLSLVPEPGRVGPLSADYWPSATFVAGQCLRRAFQCPGWYQINCTARYVFPRHATHLSDLSPVE